LKDIKDKILGIYLLVITTLISLCLLVILCIFLTELDRKTIEKEEEYQKLEYYRTLNKVYGGKEWQ
jgi:hypothetical protein